MLDDLLYGAVGSLDDTGFAVDTIAHAVAHVLGAAVGSFAGLGFAATDFAPLIEAAIHGALDGLEREAGISDSAQIETALGFCVEGAVAGLAAANLSPQTMDKVIAHIVTKTIEHIDNIGIDPAATETVVEEVVLKASGALLRAGFQAQHLQEYGTVLGSITLGAAEALAEVGLTDAQIQDFLDDIIHALFKPLPAQQLTQDQATAIGTHFQAALRDGMGAEHPLTYDEAAVNAHIREAVQGAYGG